jgi:L-ascorbate metabolism protein UlaG (beta-lactamase superfamily)
VEITWLGHACFRLRSENQVVITDPFPESLGLRPDSRPATVVTISNPHPNHSYREGVAGEPRVLSAPGEYQYAGVSVRGIMTPLAQGAPQEQRNVAYSITLDGVNVCHLGDINVPITPRQVADLSPADVLLVPLGGGCTLELEEVLKVMENLAPKIVIPMHYSIPGVTVALQGVEGFLRRMGTGQVEPQPRLLVTPSNLPEDLRIVLLAPQSRQV